MPRVRILKDMADDASVGDILNLGKGQAKELIAKGFAELVDDVPSDKTTKKKRKRKKSATPKTVEEMTAVLDKWADDGIEVVPTKKAARSVLKEEFGKDFCDEDIKTALDLLKNPPIDIDKEAIRLAEAISHDDLEFNTITGVQTFAKSKKKEFADVTKEIAVLALSYHKRQLKEARKDKKAETEPENIVYSIGDATDINYIHPAQHFDRETGEAWFGFELPLTATDAVGNEKTEDVFMLVTLGKNPIPCVPKFLKMSGKKLLAIPYSAGVTGNRISNECLNSICSENIEGTERAEPSERTERVYEGRGAKNIFLKSLEMWRELIWFRDERWYEYVALWTIGTYLHRLFATYPQLFLNGPKGSAKSRVAEIISLIGFNGELSPNLSPASLFRTIESRCATLCLDELELIGKKKELFHEIRSMFLAGYKAGSIVKRTEPSKSGEFRQVGYNVYSPKLIANIDGLDDTLKDRCIPIMMQRLGGSKLKPKLRSIVNRIVRTKNRLKTFQKLRDDYYMLVYKHWQRVDTLYQEAEAAEDEKDISARHLELWLPILIIARFFDGFEGLEGIEDRMRELIKDSIKSYRQQESDSNEHILLNTLWNLVKDQKIEDHELLSYKNIRQAWINHIKGWVDENEKRPEPEIPSWMTGRFLGTMFRSKLNFDASLLRRGGSTGAWHATLSKRHIQELIEYFDVDIGGEEAQKTEKNKKSIDPSPASSVRSEGSARSVPTGIEHSDIRNHLSPPSSDEESIKDSEKESGALNLKGFQTVAFDRSDTPKPKKKKKRPLQRVVKEFSDWLEKLPYAGQRGFYEKDVRKVYGPKYLKQLNRWIERGWLTRKGKSVKWGISDEGAAALAGGYIGVEVE